VNISAKWFLLVLSSAWVLPAWWFGASHVGGEWLLLLLATAALILALLRKYRPKPSRYDTANERRAATPRYRTWGHNRAFWAGGASLLFLGYILLQALNSEYGFVPGWPVGKLFPQPHLAWLPSGLATPFSAFSQDANGAVPFENAWRYLLIFSGAIVLMWATALGLNRTRLVRAWLEMMLAHAVLFSAVALAHNLSGSRLTYWFFYDPANRLGGSQFPNGNQQGAYQLILLAITLAAAFTCSEARPFPALRKRRVWMIFAPLIVWLGVVTGWHRAGLLLGTFLMLFALALAWQRGNARTRAWLAGFAACGMAILLAGFLSVRSLRETTGRFSEVLDNPSALLAGGEFRSWQHEVAWQMHRDAPWYGWGAGSYLYLFGTYYPRVPQLTAHFEAQRLNRVVFAHADGDWLEFLLEYGIVGMALLMTPAICWLAWLLPRVRRVGREVWLLTAGIACVSAQAAIDPALRNPMVFSGVAALAWLAIMLHRAARRSRDLNRFKST